MADRLSTERRSWNMAQIKSKDTSIEVAVRHYLFSKGYRYRKNDKRYPGKPDIILPKYNTAIFIHGCFWHRHPNCKIATTPKTNTDFWLAKFQRNINNDKFHQDELRKAGWDVIILWQCEIEKKFDDTMTSLLNRLSEKEKQ